MVEDQDIDLLDDENKPFLQKQLTNLMNNQNATDTGGADQQVDIRIGSPTMNKLEDAELQINDQKYKDLQRDVKKYVRRTSMLKEAQKL